MEGVIGLIVSKIDMVLIKLESMEKTKSKKKPNLSKMFEGLTGESGTQILPIILLTTIVFPQMRVPRENRWRR